MNRTTKNGKTLAEDEIAAIADDFEPGCQWQLVVSNRTVSPAQTEDHDDTVET